KMIRELLTPGPGSLPYTIETLVVTRDWLEEWQTNIPVGLKTIEVTATELRQVSLQQEPNRALALVHQMEYRPDVTRLRESLSLGLENIQDPGNMGAIIRIADWFGIRDIICSGECVELYNPKVIQSTMGSFLRVHVHCTDLPDLIGDIRKQGDYQVFGTGSQGANIYKSKLPQQGLILLGNESRGLSGSLMELADRVVSIPFYDPSMHPESLNVATATAILCAEFRRQAYP
ncbi:MAG: RNA methyltransferase, partial [Bacteroidales bacterium]|nr:RNA methyltransferase [Bacteroidales bacterium]